MASDSDSATQEYATMDDCDTQEYDLVLPPSKRLKTEHAGGDIADHQLSDPDSDATCSDILINSGAGDCNNKVPEEETQETQPYDDVDDLLRQNSVGSAGFKPLHQDHGMSNGVKEYDDGFKRQISGESGGFEPSNDINIDMSSDKGTVNDVPSHSDNDDADSTSSESLIPQAVDKSSVESQTAGPSGGPPPKMRKIASVAQDAANIAGMLGMDDSGAIYQRLKQLRGKGNRTDLVTNEILETGVESFKEKLTSEEDEEGESGIFDEIDDVKSKVLAALPDLLLSKINPDEVFALLEANESTKDRVSVVAEILIKKNSSTISNVSDAPAMNNSEVPTAATNQECDLFQYVGNVLKNLPDANPNEVYNLLETNGGDVQKVTDILQKKLLGSNSSTETATTAKTVTATTNHDSDDQDGNPLYKDMKVVSSFLPYHDKNEIYAYLEAHYHRPNRVQFVTEELIRVEQNAQTNDDDSPSSQPTAANLTQIEMDVAMLHKIFPDCDPNYLFEQLEIMAKVPDRVNALSSRMFDRKDYPKLVDRLEKEKKQDRIRKFQTMELDMEDFLETFPDPGETFHDTSKEPSDKYKKHADTQLLNDFPMLSETYIRKKLKEHKEHYLPARTALTHTAEAYMNDPIAAAQKHKRFLVTQRHVTVMPDNPDELFYKELLFAQNEDRITEYIQEKKTSKERRLEEAREKDELYECTCCYDDEVLFEDMLACPEGHLFCKECVRRQAESNIGEAKTKFPCIDGECDLEFPMSSLQAVLSAKNFSVLLRRIQEEEIRQADIDDLVSCPFCSFATIMTNLDDRVFKCQNTDCLKESCRLCREPNHIPLRCSEVEKESEKDMRAYIESRMTEAMIRVCWKCKKRFFKIEGCNKMTCTCGASMCYVCREPIEGYDHFNTGTCNNVEQAELLHKKEMEEAAEAARQEYERDHPETAGTTLKHDPTKLLDVNTRYNPRGGFHRYDADNDEEGYENSERSDYTDSDDDYEDDYY